MSRSRSNKRKITVALLGALFCGVGGNSSSAQDTQPTTSSKAPIIVGRTQPQSSLVRNAAYGMLGLGVAGGAALGVDKLVNGPNSIIDKALNGGKGNNQDLQAKYNEQIKDLQAKLDEQVKNSAEKETQLKNATEQLTKLKATENGSQNVSNNEEIKRLQELVKKLSAEQDENLNKQEYLKSKLNEELVKQKQLEEKIAAEKKQLEEEAAKKEKEEREKKAKEEKEKSNEKSSSFSWWPFGKKKAIDPSSVKKEDELKQQISELKLNQKHKDEMSKLSKEIAVLKEQKKNAEAKNPGLFSKLFNKSKKAYVKHELKDLNEKNVELEKQLKEYKDKEEQQKAELRKKDSEANKKINDSISMIRSRINSAFNGAGYLNNIVKPFNNNNYVKLITIRNATAFFTKAVAEKRIEENDDTRPFFEAARGEKQIVDFSVNYLRLTGVENHFNTTSILNLVNNVCGINYAANNIDDLNTCLVYTFQVGSSDDDKYFSFYIIKNNSDDLKVHWEAHGNRHKVTRGDFILLHNRLQDMKFFDLKNSPSDYNFVPLPGGKWDNTKAIGLNIGKAIWGTTKKIGRGIGKGGKWIGYKTYDAIQKARDNDKAERNIDQRNLNTDSEIAVSISSYSSARNLFGYGVPFVNF